MWGRLCEYVKNVIEENTPADNGPAGPRAEAAPPIDPLAQRPGESRQAWVERLGAPEEKNGG